MKLNLDQEKPIFIQIAEGIEDGILTGAFLEEKIGRASCRERV